MKKIISFVAVFAIFLTTFSFTATAAESKVTYDVDWSSFSFDNYWYDELKNDSQYKVNATKNAISFTTLKGDNTERRAYVADMTFPITDETKYEYVFQAKNDSDYKYGGVVFAFAEGLPYFVYGSFNNVSDAPNDGKSDIRVQKGLNYEKDKACSTGFTRSYIEVALDSQGYGTFKVVIDGYTASFYGLTNASTETYTVIGNSITLPSDAVVAFGVFNRGYDKKPITISVKNARLTALNDAAIEEIAPGLVEFIEFINAVKEEHPAVNYTEESYGELDAAIKSAEELISSGSLDGVDLASLQSNIESLIAFLELADTDFSNLEALAADAAALEDICYTEITYSMMLSALEAAQELLELGTATQAEVNAAFDNLKAKMDALVATGVPPTNSNEDDEEEGVEDDFSDGEIIETAQSTDPGVNNAPSETTAVSEEGGCKSSLAISSLAATLALGFAFAFKKKED